MSAEYDVCGSTILLFHQFLLNEEGTSRNSLPTCLAASGRLIFTDNIVLGDIVPNL
jgi:hypothetical protein